MDIPNCSEFSDTMPVNDVCKLSDEICLSLNFDGNSFLNERNVWIGSL